VSNPDDRELSVPEPLVIVGPTASGKTGLALALARRHPGTEILSADAMAVYRNMTIGTAKPTPEEQRQVPHHGIDLYRPDEEATVADYQRHAEAVLAELESRQAGVIVVGGTGLYVRAVVDRFTVPPRFPDLRRQLEADPDTAGLWSRLVDIDPAAADKMLPSNRRRIIRALEVALGTGRPFSSFGPGVDHYPATRFRLVGLDIDRATLDTRIDARYDRQLADGLVAEVAAVHRSGLSRTAAQALGYKELIEHLEGRLALDVALEEAKRRTRRFARRQQRWFRRDPRITWFDALADDLIDQVDLWWTGPAEEPSTGGPDASVAGGR
jgi:tRNA dimethylallyltransferase